MKEWFVGVSLPSSNILKFYVSLGSLEYENNSGPSKQFDKAYKRPNFVRSHCLYQNPESLNLLQVFLIFMFNGRIVSALFWLLFLLTEKLLKYQLNIQDRS